jgi:hypothetical protein
MSSSNDSQERGSPASIPGQLQHLGKVEIAGEVVVLLPESPHLHAPGGPARPGILHALPLPDQLLDDEIRIEDGGLAEAGRDDPAGPAQESIRVLLAELYRRRGLEQTHLLNDVQDQVRYLVDGVRTVGLEAPRVDLGEIGVGGALLRRDPNLGRRRVVVELHPEALE